MICRLPSNTKASSCCTPAVVVVVVVGTAAVLAGRKVQLPLPDKMWLLVAARVKVASSTREVRLVSEV
jgi:hypothetical protein